MTRSRTAHTHCRTLLLVGLLAFNGYQYAAAQEVVAASTLADLSLEELGNIEVTSVSRRPEALRDAPAAIFVITSEDIRSSGAVSLPEALRLAPNLQVARVNGDQYAISARGFNNAIGNKLLVLIDGRTVYSPLFSGVFWDAQDVLLEHVERIEVISGPGAALWGANAVNGVINVITRSANATQGALVTAGGGNKAGTQGAARYGGTLSNGAAFRIYALGTSRKASAQANGVSLSDNARKTQAGFRVDWGTVGDGFTVQGDAYDGGSGAGQPNAPRISGANLLARVSRQQADGSGWRLQAYLDNARRSDPNTFIDSMDVADVEFQQSNAKGSAHQLLWGGGLRVAHDQAGTSQLITFIPADQKLRWANVFIQDEWTLQPRWVLTLGAKAESNIYTGWEWLPSVRLAWKPSERQLVWGSISRAVRAPARLDREFFFPGRPPFFIVGGPNFVSEVANVLEIGYRAQPRANLNYSVTAFHHVYSRLRSGARPPAQVQNQIEGSTSGIEAWASYQPRTDWRLSAGLVELRENLFLQAGSPDPTGPSALGNDPRHQFMLRSTFDLSGRQELDFILRHVGALPNPFVPAYTALDARWGMKVNDELDLSVTLQNLFDRQHPEFGAAATASQVDRGIFLKAVWRR